ncbi:MAG: molybdopterin molybdotransferase MoeA [Elusimicrobia bacterium]|nr:molybdopterin molybdotransferase MoeA [Elusimicrobiota bacterium]
MISYAEALDFVRDAARSAPPLSTEPLTLGLALGRVSAESVHGTEPIPPFDNSSMDGYALASARAAGASSAPLTLPVLGVIMAGDAPRCQAESGVWKIMTGAPVPAGCDAIIPVEQTKELDGGRAVEIRATPHEGDFIREKGHDFLAGAEVLPAGTTLTTRHLMALAAAGVTTLNVRRKPRIALISTGRELAPPGKPLAPGMIRDASSTYLAAECGRLGFDFRFYGVVHDDESEFRAKLEHALSDNHDVILTTGAVSMGDADFIPSVLKDMGARTLFHKVAIKPGRPILFAEMPNKTFVFGLPGNPVSSVVGFRFFVLPCLRELLGQSEESPIRCRLKNKTDKPEKLRCFFKARRLEDGKIEILPGQASFQIHSLLAADCWAVLPEEGVSIPADRLVDVFDL